MLVGQIGWAYIAGFFDGEGCVRAYCRNNRLTGYTARIVIAQTGLRGKAVLEEIQEFIKLHGISAQVYRTKKVNLKHTDCYSLQIGTNENVRKFIKETFPYLRVKKTEAQDVLRFIRMYGLIPRNSPVLAMLISESWNKPGVRESRVAGIKKAWADGRMSRARR